jgi:hypothetical protein
MPQSASPCPGTCTLKSGKSKLYLCDSLLLLGSRCLRPSRGAICTRHIPAAAKDTKPKSTWNMHIRYSRFRTMPRIQRVLWPASWLQAAGHLVGRWCETSSEDTRRPPSAADPKFECKHWHTRCRGQTRPHSYRVWRLYSLTAKASRSRNWNAQLLWLKVGTLEVEQAW